MLSLRRRSLLLLGALAAALSLWWPAFRSLESTGFGDWQFFHHMWEAGYVALERYGEWPLWDPYHCGGITIFGNPQSQHLSPLYFVSFLVGPTLATKIFLVVHATVGFGAMFVFARRELGAGVLAAVLASAAWGGSGFFAWHGAGGHSAFLPFYLTPLLLLAWRRAAVDPRHCASVALLMTLVLLEGGVYPFPYLSLMLVFDALVRIGTPSETGGVLLAGVVSAPLVALTGAVRVLPIVDELRRNPRHMPSEDGVTPAELVEMLTARDHPWRYADHQFVWPEYGSFVGWGVLALAAWGVAVAVRDRRLWPLVGLVLFGGLTLGDHGPFFPWPLVHELPIYDSLRVPSRFAVFLTFFLGLCAALGFDALVVVMQRFRLRSALDWMRRWAPALLLCVLVTDLLIVNTRTTDRWKQPPVKDAEPAKKHYLTGTHRYGRWYASFPRMGLGTRGCYEAMAFSPAKGLWDGNVAQARVADGKVHDWGRTTTTAWADVTLRRPGAVVFNQNYAPGWRSSVGRVHADSKGRLVVEAPAGHHRIELRYRPTTLWPGVIGSLLGLLLCAMLGIFATRERVAALRAALARVTGYRTAP